MNRINRGFTLIELMMVVAIVAVLASLSMGYYGNYVIKANRTDGRAALTETATRLEKCKAIYGAYNHANCDAVIPATSKLPEGLYTIAATRDVSTFTLTATPATGKAQTKDSDCTAITLTNTGIQSGKGDDKTQCW